MKDIGERMKRYDVEEKEKWRDIVDLVPKLHFKSEWLVKIIPPFCGAVVRFVVEHGNADVSVYLDWYDELGYMREPYYEIYPSKENDGDPARFLLNETEEMMKEIEATLAWSNDRASDKQSTRPLPNIEEIL